MMTETNTTEISTSERNAATTAVVWLGAAPADEPRPEGDPLRLALAYRLALRLVVGDEPDGAELVVRRTPVERADPYEVACAYDPADPVAVAYAERCRACAPSTWAAAGMTAFDDGPARGRA